MKIPEVHDVTENNNVFREAESQDIPFFAIRIGEDKSHIEYDFYTTDYQLTDDASAYVEVFFIEMGEKSKYFKNVKSEIVCSAGNILGISLKCELDICREYAPLIREIVFNKDNWILSKRGELNKVFREGTPEDILHYEITGEVRISKDNDS